MHLEDGVRQEENTDDDNHKALRGWNSGIMGSYTKAYTNYERWAKWIVSAFLSVWIVFVLFYWTASSGAADSSVNVSSSAHEKTGGVKTNKPIVKKSPVAFENAFPEETNFLVLGDYGTGDASQTQVAHTLKQFAESLDPKPAFVLSTGDQIYDHGILTPDDEALTTRFEQMYDHPDLHVPWYITIGNHDCEGSIDAMLQYANHKHSLWYMPERYYTIDRPVAPKTILRVIVLDACDLVCGHEPRNTRCNDVMNEQSSEMTRLAQYEWVERVLKAGKPAGIDRMWTIVVGHWAVYSFAGNADTPELIKTLDPLLQKYHVHAYFNGHDHCMQHIKKIGSDGWTRNYFVAGAGGYRVHTLAPKARSNSSLVHAAMTHGFLWVRVTKTEFQVQMLDKAGEVLYTTELQYEQPTTETTTT